MVVENRFLNHKWSFITYIYIYQTHVNPSACIPGSPVTTSTMRQPQRTTPSTTETTTSHTPALNTTDESPQLAEDANDQEEESLIAAVGVLSVGMVLMVVGIGFSRSRWAARCNASGSRRFNTFCTLCDRREYEYRPVFWTFKPICTYNSFYFDGLNLIVEWFGPLYQSASRNQRQFMIRDSVVNDHL